MAIATWQHGDMATRAQIDTRAAWHGGGMGYMATISTSHSTCCLSRSTLGLPFAFHLLLY